MPEFDTPQPISVAVELGVGNVTITATERADTLVDIVPSDDTNDSDVQAAQRIRVDHTNGVLTVGGRGHASSTSHARPGRST
ncbi:hypothetical protein D7316_01105 [Gordonia insulae]|uniref:Uncharacterized protein n=1 Tax=Gordonia insulae TaxID=2420509 RepID=A0A3G8JJ62_9ACTN|nr:hypothetical protein D7316_01105 [Gordonia insulae]